MESLRRASKTKDAVQTVWLKRFLNEGVPTEDDFEIVSTKGPAPEDLKDGQVIVQAMAMSVDPYLRGRIKAQGRDGEGRQVMEGFISGKVLASKNEKFVEGDLFGGSLPFSTIQIVDEKAVQGMWKLTGLVSEENISYGIGVLGMPGSTAYAGVSGVLRPEKEGEVMFISAASGAVGSLAGQIAQNVYGCKVIGSCGGKEKVNLVTEKFGYDEAIDYKALSGKDDLVKQLKAFAPKGIDMYFENVGGIHFDAAFESLAPGGRIAICGCISNYNNAKAATNAINIGQMIYTGQRIEGFVCHKWLMGVKGNFLKDMSTWIKEGKIKSIEETFYDGVESWPKAFRSLFVGSENNKGKVVVRV